MSATLADFLNRVEHSILTPALRPETITISGGYVSDLLSDVMGSAESNQVWITIMKHLNVIAVASMTGIPCVVFAKGSIPDQAVIDKAVEENICLVTSPLSVFELSGNLYLTLQA